MVPGGTFLYVKCNGKLTVIRRVANVHPRNRAENYQPHANTNTHTHTQSAVHSIYDHKYAF